MHDRLTLTPLLVGEREEGGQEHPRSVIFSAESQRGMRAVVADFAEGLRAGPVWRAFAWDEIQNRYRRSVLGLAWIALSYLFFVVAIAIFFGGFSSSDSRAFIRYVAIGYAAYAFLVGNLTDGCQVFTSSSTWLKSSTLPYSTYIYKNIARAALPFAIQLVVALVMMICVGWRPTLGIVWVVPALAVYVVTGIWIQLLLGLTAARYADIAHLVGTVTRILFFTTPILWVFEERSGVVRLLATFNPLTHLLAIFRAPLLDGTFPATAWLFTLVITGAGVLVSLFAAGKMARRLPFWV